MGGTGVALGEDGAAPFLNPAAISQIEDRSLAFSARFFRYSRRSIEKWYEPGPVDPALFGDFRIEESHVARSDLDSLPDTTCFFFDLVGQRFKTARHNTAFGGHTLGICLAKTEQSEFSFDTLNLKATSAGRVANQGQAIDQSWNHRSVGASWAHRLSERFALGASLFVTRAKYEQLIGVSSVVEETATGNATQSNFLSSSRGYSWDALVHLGGLYRLNDVFRIGLGVRSPSLHLAGDFDLIRHDSFEAASARSKLAIAEGEFTVKTPPRIALGLGAEWRRLRAEVDAFYHFGQDEYAKASFSSEEVSVSDGHVTERSVSDRVGIQSVSPVLNLAVGIEYRVADSLGLATGYSSDFSALQPLPEVLQDTTLFRTRANFHRASLGLISYTSQGELLFGIQAHHGDGEAAALNSFVNPNRLELVDFTEYGVMLILGGRISIRAVTETALDVQRAVEGS